MKNQTTIRSHLQAFTGKSYAFWQTSAAITDANCNDNKAHYFFVVSLISNKRSPASDHCIIDLIYHQQSPTTLALDGCGFRTLSAEKEGAVPKPIEIPGLTFSELPEEIRSVIHSACADPNIIATIYNLRATLLSPPDGLH